MFLSVSFDETSLGGPLVSARRKRRLTVTGTESDFYQTVSQRIALIFSRPIPIAKTQILFTSSYRHPTRCVPSFVWCCHDVCVCVCRVRQCLSGCFHRSKTKHRWDAGSRQWGMQGTCGAAWCQCDCLSSFWSGGHWINALKQRTPILSGGKEETAQTMQFDKALTRERTEERRAHRACVPLTTPGVQALNLLPSIHRKHQKNTVYRD